LLCCLLLQVQGCLDDLPLRALDDVLNLKHFKHPFHLIFGQDISNLLTKHFIENGGNREGNWKSEEHEEVNNPRGVGADY